uniref:Uncharacterized protein n=1 Tax=Isometrus maculatus TaxID=497827 RepID=A0A0U1SA96_ISOMC|nr:hypothetical protein [Isometrus maculatus]
MKKWAHKGLMNSSIKYQTQLSPLKNLTFSY